MHWISKRAWHRRSRRESYNDARARLFLRLSTRDTCPSQATHAASAEVKYAVAYYETFGTGPFAKTQPMVRGGGGGKPVLPTTTTSTPKPPSPTK